ncbi:MAG TPA: gluconate 2-dehydrogenase subunit 3 family protein [Fodinibius sp.]|nr:gluconate 2-dehydrogenase subunit 3 family protein [Fodinibius sp.]
MDRRDAIKTLSLGTLAASFVMTGCEQVPKEAGQQHKFWKYVTDDVIEKWENQFFNEHEFEMVRQLSNLIIPADDRSGNAEEAGVPQFIDFTMLDQPEKQTPIRGGLQWLDVQCRKQFNKEFIDCSVDEQKEMLDQIAYPKIAEPGMEAGVTFFNKFRDLVSSGFWSSKIGMEDIGYMGNQPYNWEGCSHEAMEHIGMAGKVKNKA